MSISNTSYSTIICDIGSGYVKAGFGGEDGPRGVISSIVGIPKEPNELTGLNELKALQEFMVSSKSKENKKFGLMVGMEKRDRYVGDEAISKLEIMDFYSPVKRGEVVDWDKYETLCHYLFYSELKIVPEEISILITETPLSSSKNRLKLSELLFETFNVKKIHIANSSMLGLFAYGKTSGLIVDSGFNVTSTVPIFEGYPLTHASIKLDVGGEDLSFKLLDMIKTNLDKSYIGYKGRTLADDIKHELGYISLKNMDGIDDEECQYKLPDGKEINLSSELYKHCEMLFHPDESQPHLKNIRDCVFESINKCDADIQYDIKENICLSGGTTLLKYFPEKLKSQIQESNEGNTYSMTWNPERQFSSWIGGSIVSSMDNFQYMWVSKEEYDESGKSIESICSKCF